MYNVYIYIYTVYIDTVYSFICLHSTAVPWVSLVCIGHIVLQLPVELPCGTPRTQCRFKGQSLRCALGSSYSRKHSLIVLKRERCLIRGVRLCCGALWLPSTPTYAHQNRSIINICVGFNIDNDANIWQRLIPKCQIVCRNYEQWLLILNVFDFGTG